MSNVAKCINIVSIKGDTIPSEPDIQLTHRLVQAGEVLGIKLLDHLIIGDGSFTSLKEKGYL